jgi:hypothetical protein
MGRNRYLYARMRKNGIFIVLGGCLINISGEAVETAHKVNLKYLDLM